MYKKDKNAISEEAGSVYSYDSEQKTNFTTFPVARVIFTEIWDFLLFFFSQVPLLKEKLFLPNMLNTTEKTKSQENKIPFVQNMIEVNTTRVQCYPSVVGMPIHCFCIFFCSNFSKKNKAAILRRCSLGIPPSKPT